VSECKRSETAHSGSRKGSSSALYPTPQVQTRGLLHVEGNLCIFAVSLNQQGVTMRRLLYLLGLLIAGGGR
jgi:hypothetical protein